MLRCEFAIHFSRMGTEAADGVLYRYWAFKFAVLDLLSLIVNGAFDKPWITKGYYVILTLTYFASFGGTFADCRPLSLNWQVYPDPGTW